MMNRHFVLKKYVMVYQCLIARSVYSTVAAFSAHLTDNL